MKQTYEELEQQLAESHRALRAETTAHENTQMQLEKLAAENVGLKAKLIFWDWDDPETSYDSPEELAEAFSLNYNEEFTVMVAAKLPNRVYRVCESWEQECKVELVEGGEVKTPATDAYLAEVHAQGVDSAVETIMVHMNHQHVAVAEALHILRTHAAQLRKGVQS